MAMTKKERAEFDRVLYECRVLGALRWTEPVLPDVEPPEKFTQYRNGWLPNANTQSVTKACTTSQSHGVGMWDRTQSQRSLKLYSTRLRALKALRYEFARSCAEKLARIDGEIALEEAAEVTGEGA